MPVAGCSKTGSKFDRVLLHVRDRRQTAPAHAEVESEALR